MQLFMQIPGSFLGLKGEFGSVSGSGCLLGTKLELEALGPPRKGVRRCVLWVDVEGLARGLRELLRAAELRIRDITGKTLFHRNLLVLRTHGQPLRALKLGEPILHLKLLPGAHSVQRLAELSVVNREASSCSSAIKRLERAEHALFLLPLDPSDANGVWRYCIHKRHGVEGHRLHAWREVMNAHIPGVEVVAEPVEADVRVRNKADLLALSDLPEQLVDLLLLQSDSQGIAG